MDKYIEKIKKLMRLASSDNEHEAKLAMVKAQRLMAEHKLEMADLGLTEEMKIINQETKWYFTTYRNLYRNTLMRRIANLYCCEYYISTAKKSKKHYICVIGFEHDVSVLLSVFGFIDSCIQEWFAKFKKSEGWKYSNEYLNGIRNDYGYGFAQGLQELLEAQMQEKQEEWGLVLVTPKEATDFVAELENIDWDDVFNIDVSTKVKWDGYEDGLHAAINDKLASFE